MPSVFLAPGVPNAIHDRAQPTVTHNNLLKLVQIKELARPAPVDLSRRSILNEVLWSDPTDSDERVGCHPNARGPNTVSYGPDRVRAFCDANPAEDSLRLLERSGPPAPTCISEHLIF